MKVQIYIYLCAAAIMLYVGFRAYTLSITHDEAFTYTRYVSHSYQEIITYQTGNILPNNHILNTVSQKFFSDLFGASEFALRIGSLISCLMLLLTAWMFARCFKGIYALAIFVILTIHPYVLDFMGLSRGYSMAYSCMMISLFFLIKSLNLNFRLSQFLPALFFAIISVWANFSMLTYYVLLSLLFIFFQIVFISKSSLHLNARKISFSIIAVITGAVILYSTVYEPLKIIIERKQLFGGEKGFWSDSVLSLFDRLGYGAGYLGYWMEGLQVLSISILFITILQLIYAFSKRKFTVTDQSLLFLFLLNAGTALGAILQHYFMGSYFPRERLALSLIPPFLIMFLFLIKSIELNTKRFEKAIHLPLLIISGLLIIHMIHSFNLTYVLDWKYDANTNRIAHDLESLPDTVNLGVHPLYEPSFNFYRLRDHLTKFQEPDHDGYRKEGNYNYFVIADEDRDKMNRDSLFLIKEYFPSKTLLARKSPDAKSDIQKK